MDTNPRRSITVTSDGEQHIFTGNVKLRKLGATDTSYILMDGEVVWQQRVRNGQTSEATFTLKGFPDGYAG